MRTLPFRQEPQSNSKATNFAWCKNEPLLEIEYFEIANEDTLQSIIDKNPMQKYRAFIAVFAGNIRLIDNLSL